MGGCTQCMGSFMIFVVSTVFLAVGASLTFGFTAAVVMPVVSVFVPAVVAYGGIAAGVLILLLSISGYSGICCKKWCAMFVFMIFSFMIFVASVVVVGLVFFTDDAMQVAKRQNYVDLGDVQKSVIDAAAVELDYVLGDDGCNVETAIKQNATTSEYYLMMNCTAPDFAADAELTTMFNDLCLGPSHPLNLTTGSDFQSCLVSDYWPFPNTTVNEGLHEKSLFCQCFAEFTEVSEQYYTPAKGVGIVLVLFFFLTFCACCYLCCCAKDYFEKGKKDKGREMKENYFARP